MQPVSEHGFNAHRSFYKGKVLEWLKRHAWKACNRLKRFGGSNPPLSAELGRVSTLPFCVFGGLNDWFLSVCNFFSFSGWVRFLYKGIVFYLRYIAIYCDVVRCMTVSGVHLLYTKNRNVVHRGNGKVCTDRNQEIEKEIEKESR